ncbi:hypothetical protein [Micromonospora sp. DT63]|uniref:hypothetical protein n=1 Tax=Micromonospora sp. DT63 TaxID=3393441 RepID=UPI003CF56BE1
MPPRRRPRSWLAGRLRSAAGAVHRLAGLVENTGAPAAPPAEVPRRLGEPPAHWLNLVAAHAPGLLRELDLDATPTGVERTPGGDDRRDGGLPSSTPAHEIDEGAGSAWKTYRRVAGRTGRRVRGPAAQPDDAAGSRAADTADDRGATDDPRTVDGPGAPEGHGLSRAAGLGRTAGTARTGEADRPGGTGARGRAGAVGPDGSRQAGRAGGSGRVPDVSGLGGRPGGSGVGRAGTSGGSDATHLPGGHDAPTASPPANRHLSGRILEAWPARQPSWRGATTRTAAPPGPLPRDTTTTDAPDPTRAGVPAAPPTRRGSPPGIATDLGPSRGTFPPRITTAPTAVDGVTAGGAGSGLWPALPDERAPLGGVRATQRGEPDHRHDDRGHRDQREPSAAQLPVGPASTAVDPWPELPDDTPLWTVPPAALDARHVDRLDREQAGG